MERRRRPTASCLLCRKQKIRCNREQTFSNCLRARTGSCVYKSPNRPASPRDVLARVSSATPRDQGLLPSARASRASAPTLPAGGPSGWTGPSTPTSPGTAQDEDSRLLRLQIRELENKVATATLMRSPSAGPAPYVDIETTNSRLSGTFHVHCRRATNGQPETIAQSVNLKLRSLGQSH